MSTETKALAPIEGLRQSLTQMQPQFAAALPPHIQPEKFVRVVMTALQKTPDLLNADRNSLYGACMAAAQQGLLPDGREGAIVPFAGKAQWMPMVSGILKLIRNSGDLSTITAQAIYKNDQFKYWVDDSGEHVEHTPLLFGEPGEMIGVYALAKVKDGGVYVEVMTLAQIEQVRNVSRAKNAGPWRDWYPEMAKKSAIRRLSKRLPMSTDIDAVIRHDDEQTDFSAVPEAPAIEPGPQRLKAIIQATRPVSEVAPAPEPQPTDKKDTPL